MLILVKYHFFFESKFGSSDIFKIYSYTIVEFCCSIKPMIHQVYMIKYDHMKPNNCSPFLNSHGAFVMAFLPDYYPNDE